MAAYQYDTFGFFMPVLETDELSSSLHEIARTKLIGSARNILGVESMKVSVLDGLQTSLEADGFGEEELNEVGLLLTETIGQEAQNRLVLRVHETKPTIAMGPKADYIGIRLQPSREYVELRYRLISHVRNLVGDIPILQENRPVAFPVARYDTGGSWQRAKMERDATHALPPHSIPAFGTLGSLCLATPSAYNLPPTS